MMTTGQARARRSAIGVLLAVVVWLAVSGSPEAQAQQTVPAGGGPSAATTEKEGKASGDGVYSQSGKAVFVLFVVALLLESGLALIFNWRPFYLFFTGGAKTVISLAFAYVFVTFFNLDIVTTLVNVYSSSSHESGLAGRFLTALIVAGGSSGVNTLLLALGFRSVKTAEQVAPKPPKTEGWVSVRLIRQDAVGNVDVFIGDPDRLPIAGTIAGSGISDFRRNFQRDPGSFPSAGGYSVPAHSKCRVEVRGHDNAGAALTDGWGPYTIAPGVIVDLKLTL